MELSEKINDKLYDYIETNLKNIEIESGMRTEETFPSENTLNQKIDLKDENLVKELKSILKDRASFKIKEFDNIFINIESKNNKYELTNKNTKIRLNNSSKENIIIDIEIDEILTESESYQYAHEEYLTNLSSMRDDYYYDMMRDDMLTGN
jgi:hypothetical protein